MNGELVALVTEAEGDDPPRVLWAAAAPRRQVNRLAAVRVRRARVQGSSWGRIAQALEVSRQAIHRKFGGGRLLGGR
ncbi:hypothetical protein [Microtetraspora malaysiensis]|uniref:Helix-turn-helix domain-containing protein n=1 Tax=Microtetraspora malaysiensis TaxID=161358 RepID=A0ABW6SSZ7_9ACTN